jgi:hypothetical protein
MATDDEASQWGKACSVRKGAGPERCFSKGSLHVAFQRRVSPRSILRIFATRTREGELEQLSIYKSAREVSAILW